MEGGYEVFDTAHVMEEAKRVDLAYSEDPRDPVDLEEV